MKSLPPVSPTMRGYVAYCDMFAPIVFHMLLKTPVLPVKCTPDKIPAKVEVDVSNVELNNSLHVRDLSLPTGVVVMLDQGQTIVSVVTPEKEEKAAPAK